MKKMSITIEEQLQQEFKKHCELNAYKMSTRICYLIRKDLGKGSVPFVKELGLRGEHDVAATWRRLNAFKP